MDLVRFVAIVLWTVSETYDIFGARFIDPFREGVAKELGLDIIRGLEGEVTPVIEYVIPHAVRIGFFVGVFIGVLSCIGFCCRSSPEKDKKE